VAATTTTKSGGGEKLRIGKAKVGSLIAFVVAVVGLVALL
jgi:hypothetical protein